MPVAEAAGSSADSDTDTDVLPLVPARHSKCRAYCMTFNNWTPLEYELLKADPLCRYVIIGKEVCPQTQTPHLQVYCYYKNQRLFSAVKNKYPRAHIEKARGTISQNIAYCKKEGQYEEVGTPPKDHDEIDRNIAYRECIDLARSGDLEKIKNDYPGHYVRHYKTLLAIADAEDATASTEATTGVWYHGPPGTGKSHTARAKYPDAYIKGCNKWWDHYRGQDNVIIDDFDLEHKVLGHHIKIWSDKYPFPAEYKGGARNIRPKKIIITSNYLPEQIWSETNIINAIRRRFEFIEMNTVYKPPKRTSIELGSERVREVEPIKKIKIDIPNLYDENE